jgi:hypothetical protein
MKQYFKEEVVFVPDPEGKWEVCNILSGNYLSGKFSKTKSDVIVLTEEELLDLMQEAIEHSNTTLLREKASELLKAKLANQ